LGGSLFWGAKTSNARLEDLRPPRGIILTQAHRSANKKGQKAKQNEPKWTQDHDKHKGNTDEAYKNSPGSSICHGGYSEAHCYTVAGGVEEGK
jgi:hypothetical protein